MAVNATAVWRVRTSGSNSNGGGYDSGIGGAATDYSQQNAAQATGTHGAGSATTTFTDATAANFTSAMVGNAINISGQGFYFVTAFTSATQVVVDRALGTFSGASWSLGGGWADFTNITTGNPTVGGNIVYVLGSGTPNSSSYTYDYTISGVTAPAVTGGFLTIANDPQTPGYKAPPDTTGGMPVIKVTASQNGFNITNNNSFVIFSGLWLVVQNDASTIFNFGNGGSVMVEALLFGCVIDEFGNSSLAVSINSTAGTINCYVTMLGCEIFSSAAPSTAANNAITVLGGTLCVNGCNFHDLPSGCILMSSGGTLLGAAYIDAKNTIFANYGKGTAGNVYGVDFSQAVNGSIVNCTFDGGTVTTTAALHWGPAGSGAYTVVMNNIISNFQFAGALYSSGSAAANTAAALLFDYNTYYNNALDVFQINKGAHDTTLLISPYVNSSIQNYALA